MRHSIQYISLRPVFFELDRAATLVAEWPESIMARQIRGGCRFPATLFPPGPKRFSFLLDMILGISPSKARRAGLPVRSDAAKDLSKGTGTRRILRRRRD